MITLAAANAAYNRIMRLAAEAGDTETLIAAAQQDNMPVEIVALGSAIDASEKTWAAYKQDSFNPLKAKAWDDANKAVTKLLCCEENWP